MEIKKYSNGLIDLPIRVYKDNSIEFDAEKAAIGLGLTEVKNGKTYVIWKRVSKYLSTKVSKGDFITEPQFYKLAIKANNETAEKFQDWVTNDVLPSIRKHGAYMTPKAIEKALLNPDTIITLATQLKDEQKARKQLEQENAVMKPKAIFADVVATSQNSIAIGTFAKVLRADGIKIGQNRLFQWLRDNGYLIARYGRSWNKPTQKAMDQGLFEMKANTFFHNSGEAETNYTPLLTGKGQVYFANKFKTLQKV
ncbi:phage antirepressor KilAC domain-containing protein [Liquorilactobacillus nagelii]|jgi:anti-repressor protein|uniref:phage antirepressor KilAC domain-containing protein n=1 Tax=Liquorilactobacillus nagelii TaxID=82688 RepID=UPI0031192171